MTTIRRTGGYSADPIVLAKQVGELARDVREAFRLEMAGPFVHEGKIRLPFLLDVGGKKPLALIASYTDEETEQSTEATWKWVGSRFGDGQCKVTSLTHAPASTVRVSLRFFAIREAA